MAKKNVATKGKKDLRIENIGDIIALEKQEKTKMSLSDKIADSITSFSGSMLYVLLHVLWFGGWIITNVGLIPSLKPYDPFPFSLLTMIVSLEAIFLSSFVLISQNKQAQMADKRAKIDLQINMLDEQETTNLLKMVSEIHKHLHLHKKVDAEVQELAKTTDLKKIAARLDKAEKNHDKK